MTRHTLLAVGWRTLFWSYVLFISIHACQVAGGSAQVVAVAGLLLAGLSLVGFLLVVRRYGRAGPALVEENLWMAAAGVAVVMASVVAASSWLGIAVACMWALAVIRFIVSALRLRAADGRLAQQRASRLETWR